ncbi:MAG: AsmA-like C-terminal domain-containing protein, partial [Sedimentisphaerales bacterium]|nr:AsmA-like C-terminal domain-containing protein [Sedimentisphaerales bacterium]
DATYRQFQFPLRNMTGTMFLDLQGDSTMFNNVVSAYEGRRIIINGWTKLKGQKWDVSKGDNDIYCLSLEAAGLELEKDVAPLLPPKAANVLAVLKASGKVRIIAQMSSNAGEKCAPRSLAIECMGDSIDYAGLPYPLRDIRGKLSIIGDEVKFENVTAAADANVQMAIDGKAGFGETGLKWGQFKVGATNIAFDNRFGQLLGEVGQDIYKRLSPQGRADITLDMLNIAKDGNDVNSVDARGGIVFKECGFSSMLPVSGLDGRLNFDASYKRGGGLKSTAKVDIDSVKVKGKLLQRLFADVRYDDTAGTLDLNNIIADFYGGKLVGTFKLAQEKDGGSYALKALFEHINLREFLAFESGETPDFIAGIMGGEIDVNSQQNLRNGKVQLRITEMKVGKLSFFGKVLAVFKLTEPKDYAFENMIVTAYLRDNELMVEQMDLSSNAFAMRGQGSIDIEKNSLNLQFIAAGPRLGKDAPMLESLAEGLSPAMARVAVTGDLKNPKVEQTTLPVIKDTLEMLGSPKN